VADDDNVIPLRTVEPEWAAMVRLMERLGVPVTRENYLAVVYAGAPHEEDDLPPFLREDPPPSGFPRLTKEQYDDWERTR
jgi:hypothetical protein